MHAGRRERLAPGGGRGRRHHGVSRRVAATLEGVAGARRADRHRGRSGPRLHRRGPPHRLRVSCVHRRPRLRRGTAGPGTDATSDVAPRGRIGHRRDLGGDRTTELRMHRKDRPQWLLGLFRPSAGPNTDGVPGRRPHARSVITQPGAGLLHAATGRRRACRHRPARTVLRRVAVQCSGQRHGRAAGGDRAACGAARRRDRGRRDRVPHRGNPGLRRVHNSVLRPPGASAHRRNSRPTSSACAEAPTTSPGSNQTSGQPESAAPRSSTRKPSWWRPPSIPRPSAGGCWRC